MRRCIERCCPCSIRDAEYRCSIRRDRIKDSAEVIDACFERRSLRAGGTVGQASPSPIELDHTGKACESLNKALPDRDLAQVIEARQSGLAHHEIRRTGTVSPVGDVQAVAKGVLNVGNHVRNISKPRSARLLQRSASALIRLANARARGVARGFRPVNW